MKTTPLLLLALCGAVHAQLLVPRAPLAEKHQSDIAALKVQEDAAIARLGRAYLDALDAAESLATTAGQLKMVAAVNDERKSMSDGLEMPGPFPAGLPSSLKIPRQSFLDGFKKIVADNLERQQRVNANYLRNLATLQARLRAGSELAKQIAAEKDAVLQNATTVTTPTTLGAGTPTGANKIANGNFTEAEADGFPKGWRYRNGIANNPKSENQMAAPPIGLTFKAVEDHNETFLRATYEQVAGWIGQTVDIPSRAKEMIFRVHVRGKQTGGKATLETGGRFFHKDGRFLLTLDSLKTVGKISPNAWRAFELACKIPPAAEIVSIVFGARDQIEAVYEFQRVEVTFR